MGTQILMLILILIRIPPSIGRRKKRLILITILFSFPLIAFSQDFSQSHLALSFSMLCGPLHLHYTFVFPLIIQFPMIGLVYLTLSPASVSLAWSILPCLQLLQPRKPCLILVSKLSFPNLFIFLFFMLFPSQHFSFCKPLYLLFVPGIKERWREQKNPTTNFEDCSIITFIW